jgi:hypothetical protein
MGDVNKASRDVIHERMKARSIKLVNNDFLMDMLKPLAQIAQGVLAAEGLHGVRHGGIT